jgi:hypothetical protein
VGLHGINTTLRVQDAHSCLALLSHTREHSPTNEFTELFCLSFHVIRVGGHGRPYLVSQPERMSALSREARWQRRSPPPISSLWPDCSSSWP